MQGWLLPARGYLRVHDSVLQHKVVSVGRMAGGTGARRAGRHSWRPNVLSPCQGVGFPCWLQYVAAVCHSDVPSVTVCYCSETDQPFAGSFVTQLVPTSIPNIKTLRMLRRNCGRCNDGYKVVVENQATHQGCVKGIPPKSQCPLGRTA
jgi:hypothetical protein